MVEERLEPHLPGSFKGCFSDLGFLDSAFRLHRLRGKGFKQFGGDAGYGFRVYGSRYRVQG